MIITLSPQRRDDALAVSVAGETITVNGQPLDLGGIADGQSLSREHLYSDWLAADPYREGGALHVSLILPHGPEASEALLFPEPINAGDGPVSLPSDI